LCETYSKRGDQREKTVQKSDEENLQGLLQRRMRTKAKVGFGSMAKTLQLIMLTFLSAMAPIFLCSPTPSALPDLTTTMRIEVTYYRDSVAGKSLTLSVSDSYVVDRFRRMSEAKPDFSSQSNFNGRLRYFDPNGKILLEGEFSLDTNLDHQIFKVSGAGRKGNRCYLIPYETLGLILYTNPVPMKENAGPKPGRLLIGISDNPYRRTVLPKGKIFDPLYSSRYRLRVTKWDSSKKKDPGSGNRLVVYVPLEKKKMDRFFDAVDSVTNEPWMWKNDTGRVDVVLQISYWDGFKSGLGATVLGRKDTTRYWLSRNVTSVDFFNHDFSIGYCDYSKLYLTSPFQRMIEAVVDSTEQFFHPQNQSTKSQ
jgi:hypothetical protein